MRYFIISLFGELSYPNTVALCDDNKISLVTQVSRLNINHHCVPFLLFLGQWPESGLLESLSSASLQISPDF